MGQSTTEALRLDGNIYADWSVRIASDCSNWSWALILVLFELSLNSPWGYGLLYDGKLGHFIHRFVEKFGLLLVCTGIFSWENYTEPLTTSRP